MWKVRAMNNASSQAERRGVGPATARSTPNKTQGEMAETISSRIKSIIAHGVLFFSSRILVGQKDRVL